MSTSMSFQSLELEELRQTVCNLSLEIERLRQDNDTLRQQLLSNRSAQKLPAEILRMIFLYAMPPSCFLDPHLYRGPQSPWCQTLRTKLALIQVCKTWWATGMDLLYEDVVFRRIGQIPAFLRTLKTSGFNVESAVRKIWILCYVPQPFTEVFQHDLGQIFNLCTNVTSLVFDPLNDEGISTLFSQIIKGSHSLTSSLTSLDCGDVDYPSLVLQLRETCQSLSSLTFSLDVPLDDQSGKKDLLLELGSLKYLRCRIPGSITGLLNVSKSWVMPALKYLTIDISVSALGGNVPALLGGAIVDIRSLLRIHGHILEFLHINPCTSFNITGLPGTVVIQDLLELCPNLKHLVVYSVYAMPLSHQKIEWVDIVSQYDHCPWQEFFNMASDNFPSLKGVRTLDPGLQTFVDLPTIIKPEHAVRKYNAEFEYHFPGLHIIHSRGRIFRPDILYCNVQNDPSSPDSLYVDRHSCNQFNHFNHFCCTGDEGSESETSKGDSSEDESRMIWSGYRPASQFSSSSDGDWDDSECSDITDYVSSDQEEQVRHDIALEMFSRSLSDVVP